MNDMADMVLPYARTHDVVRFTSELVLPPRRLKPSVAAVQYLKNEKGAYDASISPMMEEPLNALASREYTGIVLVGPARSSKTFSMLLGGLTYIQTCAPGDALIIQMSTDSARDFSRGDLDRCIRHSDELSKRLSPRVRDDNTYAKYWRTGTSLKIGWPAVSQLSSKTLQYVFFTDYDRPENRDNVDGEGPMWDLGYKRIETYMSRGKCVAESSPGEPLTDPNWRATTKHEAPPAPGIMTLYNRGTRARWYWPCMHCGEYSEAKPGAEVFDLPEFEELEKLLKKTDPMSLADKFAKITCHECGGEHRMEHRQKMNMRGVWVHEGQMINEHGKAVGERRRSNICSYWLGGVAATYQRWDSLLLNYFQGVQQFTRSGNEDTLKSVTMTDLAMPYKPRKQAKARGPEEILSRLEKWAYGTVPAGVRFLTAAIDVQSNRFVVQVQGWGVGLESWLIDRFTISSSERDETEDRKAAIKPGSYTEDWNVLIEEVAKKTYMLADRMDIHLPITLTLCDSGGAEGVTMRAYEFWRTLRMFGEPSRNYQPVFRLIKGEGVTKDLNRPRVQEVYPDNRSRKNRRSGGRGDVPVTLLNVSQFKDGVSNDLAREIVGPGYMHFPLWAQIKPDGVLDDDIFAELTVEVKGAKGWEMKHGARNEAFDLCVYNRAACVMLRAENFDWSNPPPFAVDPLIRQPQTEAQQNTGGVDLTALGRMLNG